MKTFIVDNGVLVEYKGNAARPRIPKDVTEIGDWVFYSCAEITSIKIPNSVRKIGNFAFLNCINLTHINIPNSVTEIGCAAFDGCENLTSINIPDSVTRIDDDAFVGCCNLTSIKIPNSVAYIGFCAFETKKVKPQYNNNGSLRAFKAFFHDWSCRTDFHYEIGKSYHQNGRIICCHKGFHACPNPLDIFDYYYGNLNALHFAEVELSGKMDIEFDKVAASDIKIVRELSISELAEIYNNMEKE